MGFKIGDRVSRAWVDGEFIIFWKGKCKFSGRVRYGAKPPGGGKNNAVWGYAGDFGLIEAAGKPAEPVAPAPKVYGMSVAPRDAWKVVDHKMEAYGDRYKYEVPYDGAFDPKEAAELVNKPGESGYGKLRWSCGASYVGYVPERKVLEVEEYIAMCD